MFATLLQEMYLELSTLRREGSQQTQAPSSPKMGHRDRASVSSPDVLANKTQSALRTENMILKSQACFHILIDDRYAYSAHRGLPALV